MTLMNYYNSLVNAYDHFQRMQQCALAERKVKFSYNCMTFIYWDIWLDGPQSAS